MIAVGDARAGSGPLGIEPPVAVAVTGIALAMYSQGAYHGWTPLFVGLVLLGAALLLPTAPRVTAADLPIVVGAGGFATWAVVDGVLTGNAADGARYAALIVGAVVLAGVCREFRSAARTRLLQGLLLVSCLVAVTGWVGVLVHHGSWGFESPGLWRASSTLTYPNATAVVLAMAALVCLAVRADGGEPRGLGVAATALVTGMVATLSRAGLLGFGIGLAVLFLVIGWRPVLRGALAPLFGAVIATAGLLPSVTAPTPTPVTVVVAAAAAVVGLFVGGSRVAARGFRFAAGVVVAGVIAATFTPGLANFGSRFSLDSPDRWDSIRAAWQVFESHPLTGVGPGLDRLDVSRADGGVGIYRYAHNEYAQVIAELGVIGGVLLVTLLVTVVHRLHRSRRTAIGAGVLAAFAALIVHAGFDFIWHIPAIPLFAAALLGSTDPSPIHGEDER